MIVQNSILIICLIVISIIPSFEGIPVEEELLVSVQELKALTQFEKIIEKKLSQDYMKSPIYLIKWLRIAKLNLPTAELMLKAHLKWRQDNRIDKILQEDFSTLEQDLPIDFEGVDLTGKPVIAADVRNWDIQNILISTKRTETLRYLWRATELTCQKIRNLQSEGKNVTQMVIIIDLQPYNFIRHGCVNCLPVFISYIRTLKLQYPLMVDKLIFVNTPILFQNVLEGLDYRRGQWIKVFSGNKKQWQNYLSRIISPDELLEFLGGNRRAESKDYDDQYLDKYNKNYPHLRL